MSILSFAEPIESVVPVAEDALSMAALMLRTIGGLGAIAAMLMLFRPLLTGVWQALLITVKPRSLMQRTANRQNGHNPSTTGPVEFVPEVTSENSISQRNLASDLRFIDVGE